MHENDYILLSDIHNYSVCPRRWALRAIENKMSENWRTIDGTNMHKRAHDSKQNEKRGDVITMRALKVVSHTLCVSGQCDVVEFYKSQSGVQLSGYVGNYIPFPIEYKRGKEPQNHCDKRQLCAEAMCLEEMLLCTIERGALFYGETHRRVEVVFDYELRQEVIQTANDIHRMIRASKTPKAVQNPFCDQCSLIDELLITYDVSTETQIGKRRLNQVAKCCTKYGQRVQNSVFECCLDYGGVLKLQSELKGIIDPETDSLRFYNLGNNYENKVVHFGVKKSLAMEGTIIV